MKPIKNPFKNLTKRRINLIITKKHLIITGLMLILGIAVYVNYLYASSLQPADNNKVGDNYGDTRFVSNSGLSSTDTDILEVGSPSGGQTPKPNNTTPADEFFAQARLDRQKSRDEAIETLQSMFYGGDNTEGSLAVIAQNAQNITNYIESEAAVETLLRAQGFEDAICYISDAGANIYVKTPGLDSIQAAKIKDALLSTVVVPAENITIVEIN